MTAFVLDIGRDRISVAADSAAYAVGVELKPIGFASKVIGIPHLRAMLFGRGIQVIGYKVALDLMVSPQLQTIEAAAEALPEMLRTITEAYAYESGIEDHRQLQIYEAVLAGYSLRDKRPVFWTFYNYNDYELGEELPRGATGTVVVVPVLPPEFAMPAAAAKLPLDKRLIAGMHAAKRYFEANGKAIIGGEISVTEATTAGVSCRTVARFADYQQTATASAAVAARLLRGDDAVDVRDGLVAVDDMWGPGTGKSAPAASSGSRQQRRAAEKQARKAARRAA